MRNPLRPVRVASWLALLVFVVSSSSAGAQTVRGRVIDARSNEAVRGARIALVAEADSTVASEMADDSGRFVLEAPAAGTFRLRVEHVGYTTVTVGPVRVANESFTDVVLRIAPDAIPLDALTVEAESRVPWLERAGFYERQKLGLGTFIDRAAIDRRDPRRTSDLLRTIAGVRLTSTHAQGVDVLLRAAMTSSITTRTCRPPIFMDGITVSHQQGSIRIDLDAILPGDIEAIEVYAGPAQVPPKYGGAHSACGVILFWTRK